MRLILASRSERRAMLLRDAGFAFVQAEPPFIDPASPQAVGVTPADAVAHAIDLARQKAHSLSASATSDDIVLAADTICVACDGRLLGTPESPDEAAAILRSFVAKTHTVVTGVAVLRAHDERWWLGGDSAQVTWGDVDESTLAAYVATGGWRGKAGGYNLFERQADGWPITVEGDASTVVGLPMRVVVPLLEQAGVVRLPEAEAAPR